MLCWYPSTFTSYFKEHLMPKYNHATVGGRCGVTLMIRSYRYVSNVVQDFENIFSLHGSCNWPRKTVNPNCDKNSTHFCGFRNGILAINQRSWSQVTSIQEGKLFSLAMYNKHLR